MPNAIEQEMRERDHKKASSGGGWESQGQRQSVIGSEVSTAA